MTHDPWLVSAVVGEWHHAPHEKPDFSREMWLMEGGASIPGFLQEKRHYLRTTPGGNKSSGKEGRGKERRGKVR